MSLINTNIQVLKINIQAIKAFKKDLLIMAYKKKYINLYLISIKNVN